MKLITLNTWGGRIAEPLVDFLKLRAGSVDIFCFQEIFSKALPSAGKAFISTDQMNRNLLEDISTVLPNHTGFFCPVDGNSYGIAVFIRPDSVVLDSGETVIYENKNFFNDPNPGADHTRKAFWLHLRLRGEEFLVINVHGHWASHGKKDDSDRILQSQKLLELVNRFTCPKVLCGDFNLHPDTQSIALIEKSGMRNLVSEFDVISTRTHLYAKPEKFADYVFVTPDIRVNDFKVLPDVVSDHAPLFLDFDVV
jgi:endonuclease/exonuclease/phosphatase family metal-dependent hydrolase